MQEGLFQSPSRGPLSYDQLVSDLLAYVAEEPHAHYKLIVGTDSHTRTNLCFVTAVIIHRQGKGARYYYRKHHQQKMRSLRQKIFYETAISLAFAEKLSRSLQERTAGLNVEIHLDVGEIGETKELVRDVVGMVMGSGFHYEIKPNAFGASAVADRFTK